MSILIIAAIALAVVLGYKTKINTGFFCIAFAYIIGCFMLGMKTKELIAEWPTSTMFVILAVSLFYNFAAVNGTLEKMSSSLLYACRRFPGMLPYALFLVAVVLSVMGAAYFTVLAFLAPITMAICEESKMDKLTGAVAINCGALAGGNFPTAALGVVFRGLIDTAYEADPSLTPLDSFSTEMTIFGFAIVFSLILITIFRFGFKENRNIGKGITFRKPEPFEPKQRTTLNLMILMMVVVLVFPRAEDDPALQRADRFHQRQDRCGSGGYDLYRYRPAAGPGSSEGDHCQGALEHHPDDCRCRHAHCSRCGGRYH